MRVSSIMQDHADRTSPSPPVYPADKARGGEVILSGALGPTAPVKSGDAVEADFASFGRVGCRFS